LKADRLLSAQTLRGLGAPKAAVLEEAASKCVVGMGEVQPVLTGLGKTNIEMRIAFKRHVAINALEEIVNRFDFSQPPEQSNK
jgi:hypothetical protein